MTKILQSSVSSLDPLSTQDQGRIVTGDYKGRAPPSSPRSLESSQGHPGLSKHYKIRVVKQLLGYQDQTTTLLLGCLLSSKKHNPCCLTLPRTRFWTDKENETFMKQQKQGKVTSSYSKIIIWKTIHNTKDSLQFEGKVQASGREDGDPSLTM